MNFFEQAFIVWLVLCGPVYVVWWLYKSRSNYVDANEMGIRVLFGKESPEPFFAGSGAIWVWYLPKIFKCYLKIFPMDQFDMDYDTIRVMSKEAIYPTPPAVGGKKYVSVEVAIESMAYLNFPRRREMLVGKFTEDPICFVRDLPLAQREILERAIATNTWQAWETTVTVSARGTTPEHDEIVVLERVHPLIHILRMGVPVPTVVAMQTTEDRTKAKAPLEDWSEEAMTSSVRTAAAGMTWKEASQSQSAFQDTVEENYLKVDGVLINAGFRPSGIKLAIKLVLPPSVVREAQANEEAASHVAKRESIEVGDALIQMVEKRILSEVGTGKNGKPNKIPLARRREIERECLNQLTRDRTMKGGGNLSDIRVASADGSSFGKGSVAEMFGGIAAGFAATAAAKEQGNRPKPKSKDNGGQKRPRRRGDPPPSAEEETGYE